MTLSDFLLTRITEDETVARDAAAAGRMRGGWFTTEGVVGQHWEQRGESGMPYASAMENRSEAALWDNEGGCPWMAPAPAVAAHIVRQDPARTLAECEAKRRIIEAHANQVENDDDHAWIVGSGVLLRALAAVYADHPDYRDEWRYPAP